MAYRAGPPCRDHVSTDHPKTSTTCNQRYRCIVVRPADAQVIVKCIPCPSHRIDKAIADCRLLIDKRGQLKMKDSDSPDSMRVMDLAEETLKEIDDIDRYPREQRMEKLLQLSAHMNFHLMHGLYLELAELRSEMKKANTHAHVTEDPETAH